MSSLNTYKNGGGTEGSLSTSRRNNKDTTEVSITFNEDKFLEREASFTDIMDKIKNNKSIDFNSLEILEILG